VAGDLHGRLALYHHDLPCLYRAQRPGVRDARNVDDSPELSG
jgi:hypothetical protein